MRLGIGIGIAYGGIVPRPKSTEEVLYELEDVNTCGLWFPNIDEELFIALQKDPATLYGLTPRRFEELIASIFRNQGFDTTLTPETKDGGYDVIAVHYDKYTGPSRYLVECKRYAEQNRVGVGIVRGLYGVVCSENATKGLVVTSSFFTKGARDFESRNHDRVSLHDYDVLADWIRDLRGE